MRHRAFQKNNSKYNGKEVLEWDTSNRGIIERNGTNLQKNVLLFLIAPVHR